MCFAVLYGESIIPGKQKAGGGVEGKDARQGGRERKYKGVCYRADCSFALSHVGCLQRGLLKRHLRTLPPTPHFWVEQLVILGNSRNNQCLLIPC